MKKKNKIKLYYKTTMFTWALQKGNGGKVKIFILTFKKRGVTIGFLPQYNIHVTLFFFFI